jgi:DNA-binding transcriptional LysR family regulator
VNFRDLDLNLLLVFNAIFHERSISKAAKSLGLSQPAVSNALRRLRDFTGDTLFYKSGNGVAPTRAAVMLAIPLRHALDTVERSLTSVRSFDPQTSERTFKIETSDIIHTMLVPALVALTRIEAPNIKLEFVLQHTEGARVGLIRGDYELAFLSKFAITEELVSRPVWTEPMKLILSRNHPLANSSSLTEEQINNLQFVMTSHVPLLREFVDKTFRANGIERNVCCTVADTQSIYPLVATTDLAACVGQTLAEYFNQDDSLVFFDLPFELPSVEAHVAWMKSSDDDDGHRWIREHTVSILSSAYKIHTHQRPVGHVRTV